MSQEIKIGVNADTGGASTRLKDLEKAGDGVASAVGKIDKASQNAAKSVRMLADMAAKLKSTQSILSKEFGTNISQGDAQRFLENFERIRTGNGIGSSRVRTFSDFSSWYKGHAHTFRQESSAEDHRRRIMASAMQGTGYAEENGPGGRPPLAPPGGRGGQGSRGGNRSFLPPSIKRAASSALGFGMAGLGLAGIGGVMGMLSSGVGMATDESVGLDTLKRRLGDIGYSFEELQRTVQKAGEGLGITYTESAKLANQFARVSGSASMSTLGGDLRTSEGFSRAFGLDPSQGVQMFASMRRMGVTGQDDQSSRRLAMMISDSIEKGGFTAKADEVLQAIASFAQQSARASLSTPNVPGYAANLAGMTGLGYAGLDPDGASSILARANSAMMRGGAMGEASMNLMYAALGRGHDPVWAQSLMAGGLFGTEASVFGKGQAAGEFYYPGKGIQGGSSVSNWQRVRDTMVRAYGGNDRNPYLVDAVKNVFGLQSQQEAMAMLAMKPEDIQSSQRLITRAGIRSEDVNPSASLTIAQIARAHAGAELKPAADALMARGTIPLDERQKIAASIDDATKSGSLDKVKETLARAYAKFGQDDTQGSVTRQDAVNIQDTITRMGKELLDPLNVIRESVVNMANAVGLGPKEGSPADVPKLSNGKPMTPAQRAITELLGPPIDPNLPRGIRNNNPGNLKGWDSDAQHDSGGYDIYPTASAGLSAMAGNLQAYARKHGINTINGIVERWEGNPLYRTSYKNDVSRRTGFDWYDKLDMNDPKVISTLMGAMTQHENGANPYSQDMINAAVASRMSTPLPPSDPNGAAERARQNVLLNVGITGEATIPVTQGGQQVGEARLKAMPTATTPTGAYGGVTP